MDLSKDKAKELLEDETRRNFLKATGSLAAVVGVASGQLSSDESGSISGGTMAIEQAYKTSDKQWIGPDSAKSNVQAKTGRRYEAVDTQVVYHGDNGSWTGPMGVGSSQQPVPSVSTESVSGELQVREYSGSSLAHKFENALSALPGSRGRVSINPPPDGTAWDWTKDVVVDPNDYSGVEVHVAEGTRIEYPDPGDALTVEEDTSGANEATNTFSLYGGTWVATGDPSSCFRLKDTNQARIEPRAVTDFTNPSGDAAAVSVENHALFSENVRITGKYNRNDITVDFKPASVTGGSGTESFVDSYINIDGSSFYNIGFRFRGDMAGTTVINPAMFPKADNAVAYQFSGVMKNSTMLNPRADDPDNDYTGTVMFQTTADYPGRGPIIQNYDSSHIDTIVDLNDSTADRPKVIRERNDRLEIGDLGGEYISTRDGGFRTHKADGTIGWEMNSSGQVFNLLNFQTGSEVIFVNGVSARGGGTYKNGAVTLGTNGAAIEVNDSGEVVATDESGNETQIT